MSLTANSMQNYRLPPLPCDVCGSRSLHQLSKDCSCIIDWVKGLQAWRGCEELMRGSKLFAIQSQGQTFSTRSLIVLYLVFASEMNKLRLLAHTGRLKRNLGKGEQEQTVLEREAGEAAKKSSSGNVSNLSQSFVLH